MHWRYIDLRATRYFCVIDFCICLITRCWANRKPTSIRRNEVKNKYYIIMNESEHHWFLSYANSVNGSRSFFRVARCYWQPRTQMANKSDAACYFSQILPRLIFRLDGLRQRLWSVRDSQSESYGWSNHNQIFGRIKRTCNYRHSLFLSYRYALGPIHVIIHLLFTWRRAPVVINCKKQTKLLSAGKPPTHIIKCNDTF